MHGERTHGGSAHESRTSARRERWRRHFDKHWTRLLYYQLGAYGVVLLLWLAPIPNPIKLLAVTFHEFSHGVAGYLTGGRVFGMAIAPNGGGVTMGVGGSMPIILVSGYIGSVLWGAALYYASVRYRARHALLVLMLLVFASALIGWLNGYAILFGLGSLIVMNLLFLLPEEFQRFFVMMVGSACCLYAPLDVLGDAVSASPLSVMGVSTGNDVSQLAALLNVSPVLVGAVVLAIQAFILVVLVRWACTWGAKFALQRESRLHKMRAHLQRDLHPEDRRITLE
ncbi:MAG: M50 family metallopeptidase [Candidatus Hydrogenedentes bacterium]|nr:M50 family metallopeptidase [Candidatus Hydrogenedentota bacterium]